MSDTEHEPGELDDEGADDDGEGDGEPEHIDGEDAAAEPVQLGPSTEETLGKLSKANVTYLKAVERILGPDETRHECPTCEGKGIVWGEVEAAIELRTATDSEPCEACAALGVVLTGSRNPEQRTKPCGACGGRGWNTPTPAPVEAPPFIPAGPQVAQPVAGQWVEGRGFIPFGATEPLPGSGV
jgi:hypothetical protein